MTAVTSGVRSLAPASLVTVQGTGAQATEAPVRGRPEMLFAAEVKVVALSVACPWISRVVDSLCVSLDWNWT
jgi:hypothetical protein